MQITVKMIRYQFLLALMFLLVAAIAPNSYQMLACFIFGCTCFLWGLIDASVDFLAEHMAYLLDIELIRENLEADDE